MKRCERDQGLVSTCSQVAFEQAFLMYRMGQHGSGHGGDENESGEEAVDSNPQLPAILNFQPSPLVLSLFQADCDQAGDVGDKKYDSR